MQKERSVREVSYRYRMCCDWAAAQQPMLRHMCTAVTAELSCQIFGLITELHESHLARSALHLQMHSTSTLCNDLRNRITASSCLSGTLQFTLGKAPSHICHTLSVSRLPGAASLLPFDRWPSMGSLNCHADETQHSIAVVKYCVSSQFPHFGGSAACNHLLRALAVPQSWNQPWLQNCCHSPAPCVAI